MDSIQIKQVAQFKPNIIKSMTFDWFWWLALNVTLLKHQCFLASMSVLLPKELPMLMFATPRGQNAQNFGSGNCRFGCCWSLSLSASAAAKIYMFLERGNFSLFGVTLIFSVISVYRWWDIISGAHRLITHTSTGGSVSWKNAPFRYARNWRRPVKPDFIDF